MTCRQPAARGMLTDATRRRTVASCADGEALWFSVVGGPANCRDESEGDEESGCNLVCDSDCDCDVDCDVDTVVVVVAADGPETVGGLETALRETCSVGDSRVGNDVQFGPSLVDAETARSVDETTGLLCTGVLVFRRATTGAVLDEAALDEGRLDVGALENRGDCVVFASEEVEAIGVVVNRRGASYIMESGIRLLGETKA